MIPSPSFIADLGAGVLDQSIANLPLDSVNLDPIGAFVLDNGSSTLLDPLAASELERMIASAIGPPAAEISTAPTFLASSDSNYYVNPSSRQLVDQGEEVSLPVAVYSDALEIPLEDVSEPVEEEEELLVAHVDSSQRNILGSPQYLLRDDLASFENEFDREESGEFPPAIYQASQDQESMGFYDISEVLQISDEESPSANRSGEGTQGAIEAETFLEEPILDFEQVSERPASPLIPVIGSDSTESHTYQLTTGVGITTNEALAMHPQQASEIESEDTAPSRSNFEAFPEPDHPEYSDLNADQASEGDRILVGGAEVEEQVVEAAPSLLSEHLSVTSQVNPSDNLSSPCEFEELLISQPSQIVPSLSEDPSLAKLPSPVSPPPPVSSDEAPVVLSSLQQNAEVVNGHLESESLPSALTTEDSLITGDDCSIDTVTGSDSDSQKFPLTPSNNAEVLKPQVVQPDSLPALPHVGTDRIPSASDSDSSSDEEDAPLSVIQTLLGYRLRAARTATGTQGDSDSSEDELALKVATPVRKRPLKSSTKSKLTNSDRRQSPRISRDTSTPKGPSPPPARKRSKRKESPAASPIPAEHVPGPVAEPEMSPRRRR